MKYKALLMGNNQSVINDFFLQLNDYFECQNTSNRFDDIACHLKYFQPHIFIYCMTNETRDTMTQMVTLKKDKVQRKCPFVIIGTQEDCDEFRRLSVDTADLELIRPITTAQIRARIIEYMERNFGPVDFNEPEPPVASILPASVSDHRSLYDTLDPLSTGLPTPAAVIGAAGASAQIKPAAAAPAQTRRHILVIDDDFRMLKLIKRYLDETYDIATAISGKVAMKFLETKTTDLILPDYEMPEENGPAVLEKLRNNPSTQNIPVIFLTGINDARKIRQVLALKPQGYLLKPIDREKLVESIEHTIG